ncbi:hypothetical protein G3T14_04560 [Methylobacterium sp. BTF04]|uniref:hypothetical protein n=1 Tax=Methylobacterium sp. BTF04 TaxID=2708300 RepID=UPI0013D2B854|nr:hypothetical protein [Methylobacterium sp. BTF04]NEU11398.1 hypothetical protein [Methylobacterium sp. BTF04]
MSDEKPVPPSVTTDPRRATPWCIATEGEEVVMTLRERCADERIYVLTPQIALQLARSLTRIAEAALAWEALDESQPTDHY